MLFRTHFVMAILVYLLSWNIIPNKIIFLLFFLFATAFVDIDSRKSKIGNRWWLRPLQWFTKHRGMFHTLIFSVILSSVIWFFSRIAGIAFFCGYILHLLLDSFTKSGVAIFLPLSKTKMRLGFLRSGGLVEEILFVLVLLLNVFLLFRIFLINLL